jgi:hypothetical protein
MLIEAIAAAWRVTEDIADDGRSPSLADAAAASEWRRVASLDDWTAFGRLLVWATRNNHPRRPHRFRRGGSNGL